MVIRFTVLIVILIAVMILPSLAGAQTHVVAYAGTLSRIQADRLGLSSYKSGPASTTTPMVGAGVGTKLWKIRVDGSFLFTRTGESEVFTGPARQIERTARGSGMMWEAGAGWPLLKIFGFQTVARGGYGSARIRIAADLPIEDDRRFWNYGIVGTRPIGTRYILKIDVRNIHFGRETTAQSLGRFNAVTLAGFGLRW